MSAAVERFREVVRARLGLHFDDHKLGELAEVLRARMAALGVQELEAYVARLNEAELGALAERLTVGETYFFRYREQFDAFGEAVLPELLATKARPIRVLSAGCASGEEAYSLALAAEERDAGAAVEVVAFDVNPAAVDRARRARYAPWSLRETSEALRDRHFVRDGPSYALAESVRGAVRFDRRNLLDDDAAFWRPHAFDVVFCRNVIMYFDAETMRGVIDRIARAIAPGGFLFLGHAETLRGVSTSFALCHTHGTFYYRRKPGPALAFEGEPAAAAATAPSTIGLGDASWIEVIQKASERVTRLASSTSAPTHSPAPRRVDTEPVIEMMRRERFAEALALIGTPDAGDPEAQLLRAALLTIGGDLREAERTCGELLARDELNAGAHYLKALCREHAGDDVGAREHDRVASYLDAGFAMPHLHLGLLERRAGRLDAAVHELRRALDLLGTEDASRILLFGGGFGREALAALCRSELKRCEANR